jgi:hypothetical protein
MPSIYHFRRIEKSKKGIDRNIKKNTLIMVSCQISQNTRCIGRSISDMITDMLAKYLSFSSTGGIWRQVQLSDNP